MSQYKISRPTNEQTHKASERNHNDALFDELYRIILAIAMLITIIFTTKSK